MTASDLPPPPFTNSPITAGQVPRLEAVEFTPLDPALWKVKAVSTLLAGGVLCVAAGAMSVLFHPWWLAAVGAVIVACVLSLVVERAMISRMGYAVRERDFSFRSGLIGRSVATVPFARVQHVTIENGPLERRFGLSTLQLRSAGVAVSVPGLPDTLAQDLKGLVVARADDLAEAEVGASQGQNDFDSLA